MKVAELTDILQDLEKIYASAGAKVPAKDMAALVESLRAFGGQEYDLFLKNLRLQLAEPSSRHLRALEAADLDTSKFESAMTELEGDKSVKAIELDKIGILRNPIINE